MTDSAHPSPSPGCRPHRIGAVSFFNTKPLIHGLEDQPDLALRLDVPARLLDDLLAGQVDIALCPVIDYQRSPRPLVVVPVGAIACDGPTLTVRLFSRVPFHHLDRVAADTDSHSSVVLLRIVLYGLYHRHVRIDPFAPQHLHRPDHPLPKALLLIGDKVVTAQPDPADFPYQLDLGQAWKQLTGLPFVFATWLALPDRPLDDLARRLDRQRRLNAQRIDHIIDRHAAAHGWPADLAGDYLTRKLQFHLSDRHFQAIRHFWTLAHRLHLIDPPRPLALASVSPASRLS